MKYKHSEETKRKISITKKGNSPAWNKGQKWSEEAKQKMSIAHQGKRQSKESITKRILANTGKKRTKEFRLKMSSIRIGMKFTPEHKNNMSRSQQIRRYNNYNWQGKISTYERKLWLNNQRRVIRMKNGGSHTLEEWEQLKKTYNYTCLCCKRTEPEIVLSRDHIIPLIKGGVDDIWNIQPLCYSCNSRKNVFEKDYRKETYAN